MKPSSFLRAPSGSLLSGGLSLLLFMAGCAPSSDSPSQSTFSWTSSSEPSSSLAGSFQTPAPFATSSSSKSETSLLSIESMESVAGETQGVVQRPDGLYEKNGIPIINKKYGVPASYAPGVDPEAAAQMQELLGAMQAAGLQVSSSTSNFRSYDYQNSLYQNYVSQYGRQQADTFSARPGFSEHQSGLAFDLLSSSGALLTSQPETDWLKDHAAEYGFIVRYLPGKEAITGYQAEPWHLRYIGAQAPAIAQSGLSLEEYLGVEGGDYAQD